MGWNSWNHFGCNISEDLIRDTIESLLETGLVELGYNHVNIDDCWQAAARDSKGNLVADPKTFPSGIKALSDYAHSKGLKLGIYSDAGFYTCQRRPGSLGFEMQDAVKFAEWEVDYLKYDNCFNDLSKPELRYPVMRDALLSVDRAIFFSMCEWGVDQPATWASKVGNSWRTTPDIRDSWFSMIDIADQNEPWWPYAAPGGWNDPDMLEVGNGGMTTAEYRAHFSLWALMKSPLLIGCDITNMTKDTKDILMNKEVIAINQDPLGVQGHRVVKSGGGGDLEVWAGPLSENRTVVALWNRGLTTATISASLELLGFEANSELLARNVWKHADVKESIKGTISADVPSHDVAMFVLRERSKSPVQGFARFEERKIRAGEVLRM
jgi:alpha-galactosidase